MSEIDKATWDHALEAMRHAGREAGLSAAEWWEQDAIGGYATAGDAIESARLVLKGIEEGDPEILDQLPWLDLSGQWADGPNAREIYTDAIDFDGKPEFDSMPEHWWDSALDDVRDELIDTYRDAYNDRMRDRIEEMCAAHVDNCDTPEENFGEECLTDRERNAS